jgi:hypothetical protein
MATATAKIKKRKWGGAFRAKRKLNKPPTLIAPTQDKLVTKTADGKGRVVLGGQFANRAVIVERISDTEMVVKLARVIPESEAWLYDNAVALASVRKGLSQARRGQLSKGPDLDADEKLAAALED